MTLCNSPNHYWVEHDGSLICIGCFERVELMTTRESEIKVTAIVLRSIVAKLDKYGDLDDACECINDALDFLEEKVDENLQGHCEDE